MTHLLEYLVKPDKAVRLWKRSRRVRKLANRSPCKVIIGASGTSLPGWISTDVEQLNLLRPSDWKKYFAENAIDAMLAEHVWEHLHCEEGIQAAETCFRYLKPGGYLRVAVPDGLHPDPKYQEWVRPGGNGSGADDHKVLYTYNTFSQVFDTVGFEVTLLEYFNEEGEFQFQDWDPDDGLIQRSYRFDARNHEDQLNYTSLIIDAHKHE